jgi:hypothetical protein
MIYEIDYEDDRLLLLEESMDRDYESFVDSKTRLVWDEWLICKNIGPIGSQIAAHFESILQTKLEPRYYIQRKGMRLPFHCDRDTQCAINLILNDSQDAIEFRVNDKVYTNHYQTALIDTQTEHQVVTVTSDRILYKLSMKKMSFKQAKKALTGL